MILSTHPLVPGQPEGRQLEIPLEEKAGRHVRESTSRQAALATWPERRHWTAAKSSVTTTTGQRLKIDVRGVELDDDFEICNTSATDGLRRDVRNRTAVRLRRHDDIARPVSTRLSDILSRRTVREWTVVDDDNVWR